MSNVLTRLARTIESRQGADEKKSYAAKLFACGPEKCAEKFGEEAVEAIIATVKNDRSTKSQPTAPTRCIIRPAIPHMTESSTSFVYCIQCTKSGKKKMGVCDAGVSLASVFMDSVY